MVVSMPLQWATAAPRTHVDASLHRRALHVRWKTCTQVAQRLDCLGLHLSGTVQRVLEDPPAQPTSPGEAQSATSRRQRSSLRHNTHSKISPVTLAPLPIAAASGSPSGAAVTYASRSNTRLCGTPLVCEKCPSVAHQDGRAPPTTHIVEVCVLGYESAHTQSANQLFVHRCDCRKVEARQLQK